MRPALALIDLQTDFLASPTLEPAAPALVAAAAEVLASARAAGVPVVHVRTRTRRAADERMPHWRHAGRWDCEEGTSGYEPPPQLAALPGEPVCHKTYHSAFTAAGFPAAVDALGADMIVLAGVHAQSCIRGTALDAYARGLAVWLVDEAIGSDDPLHGALTLRYLAERGIGRCSLAGLPWQPAAPAAAGTAQAVGRAGGDDSRPGAEAATTGGAVRAAVALARAALSRWQATSPAERAAALRRLEPLLAAAAPALAMTMAEELGKPVRYGRREVERAIALVAAAAADAERSPDEVVGPHRVRRRPHGAVAVITPWNNPVAIPIGRLAPALAFGNTAVWKPSPQAERTTAALAILLGEAGWSPSPVPILAGDREAGEALLGAAGIDAAVVCGSPALGWSAAGLCAARRLPLQAELGGNNAAIVWPDADLEAAAAAIAEGAFGYAGQRCTANRRVVVHAAIADAFVERLAAATAALPWGDPHDPETVVGPVVSAAAAQRLAALLDRAESAGAVLHRPHREAGAGAPAGGADGSRWCAPTLVLGAAPGSEIVQQESFGPLLVVQRAATWEEALALLDAVPQGLVAALFSPSDELRDSFLREARAGVLKIDRATADLALDLPFGGWKASGIGPPEHGLANRELYTRLQSVEVAP